MRVIGRIEETSSIEDHARLIQEQVEKSLQDGQTRRLASAIVSGTYDWVRDPRSGVVMPAIEYHKRYYRAWYNSQPPPACPPRDYTCEITAIWNFLVLNVRYTGDQDGYDTYQDLRTTLESGAGDCDDFTICFCALLRSVGYPCYAKIISLDGQHWAHVYPLVEHPTQGLVALDATEDNKKPGWEYRKAAADVVFDMGGPVA